MSCALSAKGGRGRGIVSDSALIDRQDINDAYARLLNCDMKYLFVIAMESLRRAPA